MLFSGRVIHIAAFLGNTRTARSEVLAKHLSDLGRHSLLRHDNRNLSWVTQAAGVIAKAEILLINPAFALHFQGHPAAREHRAAFMPAELCRHSAAAPICTVQIPLNVIHLGDKLTSLAPLQCKSCHTN
jgi:hypothetical protein